MPHSRSESRPSTFRLIFIPAVISLAVTVLRTLGEMRHWSERWFEPVTRGIVPSSVGWVFGITWLAGLFGIYFALKLSAAGQGPKSVARVLMHGILGLLLVLAMLVLVVPLLYQKVRPFEGGNLLLYLLPIWFTMFVGALLQWPAWPALSKTLLAYGFAARIPVVIVMFLAMRGSWGTHYDYVDIPQFRALPFMQRFLETAFIPQLVSWVAFTILLGSLCGGIALTVRRFFPRQE